MPRAIKKYQDGSKVSSEEKPYYKQVGEKVDSPRAKKGLEPLRHRLQPSPHRWESSDFSSEYPKTPYYKHLKFKQKLPNITEQVDDFENYIKSPAYKEKLVNQGYENPDDIIDARLNKLQNMVIEINQNFGSQAQVKTGYIILNPDQIFDNKWEYEDVFAHELGHMTGGTEQESRPESLNEKDIEVLNSLNKYWERPSSAPNMHYLKPRESYSDLVSFRSYLSRRLGFDMSKDITPEIWEEFKNEYKKDNRKGKSSLAIDRLIDRYGDDGENIIKLHKTIALKDETPPEAATAKSGMRIIKKNS